MQLYTSDDTINKENADLIWTHPSWVHGVAMVVYSWILKT
jgi:hypothetical protein